MNHNDQLEKHLNAERELTLELCALFKYESLKQQAIQLVNDIDEFDNLFLTAPMREWLPDSVPVDTARRIGYAIEHNFAVRRKTLQHVLERYGSNAVIISSPNRRQPNRRID